MSDLISRADAIEAFDRGRVYHKSGIEEILNALPSADAVSREEHEELYRKAKEVNRMANEILADFPSYKELVSADADRPQVEIKPFDAKEVFDEMLEHLPKDKPKEPHTQFLTLDDAVIVATRLFDIKGDDVEWVRCEFEQKTYLSNEQYCIGYEAAKREIIDFINGADMRGE